MSRSRGTRGHWLLELHIGGRIERYTSASEQLELVEREVSPSAERTRVYRTGLADMRVRVAGSIDRQAVQITDRSVSWAALLARGDSLDRQRAVLRWWHDPWGDGEPLVLPVRDLTTAITLLDGFVTEPEFGSPDSPSTLVFTIDADVPESRRMYPGPQAKVDATTWVDDRTGGSQVIDAAIFGSTYPTVFGYPGSGDDDLLATFQLLPATPALAVAVDGSVATFVLMLSIGEVGASQVYVWDANNVLVADYLTAEPWYVRTMTDQLGRLISYAEAPQLLSPPPTSPPDGDTLHSLGEGGRWYASWNNSAAFGGGVTKPGDTAPLRKLGDVLAWLLPRSGHRFDGAAQAAEAAKLNAYNVDGVLNTLVDLRSWCDTNLVPLFPMRRVSSSRGFYYRFVDWWATAKDAVANLSTADRRVVRTSSIRSSRAQLANVFTLDYQRNAISGAFYARRILAPDDEVLDADLDVDERVIGSPLLRRSRALYGQIERTVASTVWTWSHATAAGTLFYWATRDAFPHRFVSYAGADLGYLMTGDVVTIADDEVGLADAVALVEAVVFGGRTVELELELLDSEIRATG